MKNRESYKEVFKEEISWFKENIQTVQKSKNKFLVDMYTIMITGSRKITPKMATAIKDSIEKCKNNPLYNPELKTEAIKKLKPVLEKIVLVEGLATVKKDRALEFVQSVKEYVRNNYRITKKQMEGLNKVYKRSSEDLFDKGNKDE